MTTYSSAIGSFAIGESPIASAFPNTMLSQTLPAYLYQQYQDDDDLQAFFSAYNVLVQEYVLWFNQISLPVYVGQNVVGPLLDWVAQGLYGISRPVLSTSTSRTSGPYNTYAYNTLAYNQGQTATQSTSTPVTDDLFKRIITWNFYKGDGVTMTTTWLKRRVFRFLNGTNGTDPVVQQTYNVGVTFTSAYIVVITLYNSALYPQAVLSVFEEALAAGVLQLPFQYSFSVVNA
jgi:hypothetical protein